MAKSNLSFVRLGNDGYEYARREDGKWFFREGYFSSYGWSKTKWSEVADKEEDVLHIKLGLEKHESGESGFLVGFGSQIVITNGKGLRLP